jgi:hypothetical protein
VWCGTPGESNRGVRALARAESIVSKASQPASTPHEPPTKWNLATSLLAPPPGSSRRCPICSRGNLLPLLFLSLDGRSAPDFGVPLLTESEPARRQFGPRSGGEAKAEAPSASSTALLLTFWKPQRCTAGSGSGSVPSAAWMRCVSGAGAYDEAAASGRGAGPGICWTRGIRGACLEIWLNCRAGDSSVSLYVS